MNQHNRRDLLARAGAGLALMTAASAARAQAPTPTSTAEAPLVPAQAEAIRKVLSEAPSHGIAVTSLYASEPKSDADLRRAAVAYARAQHGLRIKPREFDKNWGLKPDAYDVERDFAMALASNRLDAWLETLPPPFPRYRVLRDGLATYQKIQAAGGWKPIPTGPDLRVGDAGARVEALRLRLGFEVDSLRQTPASAPFDPALAEAVKAFQVRHGVDPTGVAGAQTVRTLNVSAQRRAAQIVANMERWRWMPRTDPADRIEVNIAAATFDLYTNNVVTMHFLAAAGRPKDETPILISTIRSIVFNPPWNVPASIAAKEIYPKARRDRGYFEREGFTTVKAGGGTRLVQRPGPKNALGQVKFDFDNTYSVYLHDTSARSAFTKSAREVSHGCVRLEKPVDLAERLLQSDPDFPPARVTPTIEAALTVRTPLTTPMPVELLYWTAFPQGAQLAFRDDVYGWDDKVLRLVAAGALS